MDSKLLGQKIRDAREQVGLSQEQLAQLVNKDQRTISEVEHGKKRIIINDVPLYAEALQVPILYFFRDTLINPTDLEQDLLEVFNKLPDATSKRAMIDIMEILSTNWFNKR